MKTRLFLALTFTGILSLGSVLQAQRQDVAGALYTMTNEPGGNAILAFTRGADGRLESSGVFPTGGLGTGAGLGNQGGVVLTDDDRWLLSVNAGSNSVSVFAVSRRGLDLTATVSSGGTVPVSIATHKDIVYVLNAGVPNNIRGFRLSRHGGLIPLPGPGLPLSGAATAPAQIGFSPRGDFLVVTEKATNTIDLYSVSTDGLASGPFPMGSSGATPFGFAFGKRDQIFVSEAFGGAVDASAVSSYEVSSTGVLLTVSPSVPTTETAACWAVVTNDGRFVYTTNAGSGSISGYRIDFDGSLTLLDGSGQTALTGIGSVPLDMGTSRDSRYLYVLNSGNGTVGILSIRSDGRLENLGEVGGLPATANGLAVR